MRTKKETGAEMTKVYITVADGSMTKRETGAEMKKVYIAGPLSADTPAGYINNMSEMMAWSVDIWNEGVAVFVPCLDILLGMFSPLENEYQDYFNCSLEWLKVSDAVFVIDLSPGVEKEIEVAKEHDIPVFFLLSDLMDWVHNEPIGN